MKANSKLYGLVVIAICLAAGQATTISAAAQGGQFTSEAAVSFGQKVVFTLTAVTDLPLQTITLFMQPAGAAAPLATAVPFTQTEGAIVAVYTLAPQQVRLSPFTAVRYWWEVSPTSGAAIPVPVQTITYQDDRFNWKRLMAEESGAAVTIYWTGEEMETGQAAHDIVRQTAPRLQAVAPLAPGTPLPIFLYPSSAELRAALRLNGHDWAGAHVDPALGVVMVTAVNSRTASDDLRRSLPHELAHFWLHQAAGPHAAAIPPWFAEGLALWVEEGAGAPAGADAGANEARLVAAAIAQNQAIPLAELCRHLPEDKEELAAAQSGALVKFLQAHYGERAFNQLAAAFVAGESCQTAVPAVLGQSLTTFEARWLASARLRPAWNGFLNENCLWLLLLLGGFVIMGLLVLRPKTL